MKFTLAVSVLLIAAGTAHADPMSCNLAEYKNVPGSTAAAAGETLTVTREGDRNQEIRLRFGIVGGTPTIQELAVRRGSGSGRIRATNATAAVRVVSGVRRMSNLEMASVRGLQVDLNPEVLNQSRWDPFWDAPLDMAPPGGRSGNPPLAEGVANQPGIARKADEVK